MLIKAQESSASRDSDFFLELPSTFVLFPMLVYFSSHPYCQRDSVIGGEHKT